MSVRTSTHITTECAQPHERVGMLRKGMVCIVCYGMYKAKVVGEQAINEAVLLVLLVLLTN